MLSVAHLCRCAQPMRLAQSKLLSGTRSGFNNTSLVMRQLYTPVRHGNTNKIGFRIRELMKSNQIVVRLCANSSKPEASKAVGYWLLGCSGMVFTAVVLGMVAGYLVLLYSIYFVIKVALMSTKSGTK